MSSCSSHRMGAQSRVVGKLTPKASSQRFSRPDQASLHWASRDSFEAANKHKRIHQVDPLINIMNGSPYKNPYNRYFLREVGSGFCAVNPLESLAPRVGFEPTTLRLTAECSTVELPRSAFEVGLLLLNQSPRSLSNLTAPAARARSGPRGGARPTRRRTLRPRAQGRP